MDFAQARVQDISWWRKTNALIKAMARDDEIHTIRAAFDYQRSLVGNSGLTDDSFKKSQETARELFQELINVSTPWAAQTMEEAKTSTIAGLVDMYKKRLGDPNDPEFQKKLEQDYHNWKNGQPQEVQEETPEQRIDRLVRERDAHYAAKGMRPK